MRWPWTAPERREAAVEPDDQVYATPFNFVPSVTYMDAQAPGSGIHATAARLYANALASAEFVGTRELAGLNGEVLADIARRCVLYGQAVYYIDEGFILVPATTALVEDGDHRPSTWRYRLSMGGPARSTDVLANAEDVLHFVWAKDPDRPWVGVGPFANEAGRATLSYESSLLHDSRAPVVSYLPVPQNASVGAGQAYATDPKGTGEVLKSYYAPIMDALRRTRGGLLAGSSFRGTGRAGDGPWDSPSVSGDPKAEDRPKRWGPEPDQQQRLAYLDMARVALSAAMIPPEMFTESDGATRRESYRTFFVTGLLPFAKRVAQEISRKLAPVKFAFDDLAAIDLQQRSRAYKGFIDAGLSHDAALGLVGLQQGA